MEASIKFADRATRDVGEVCGHRIWLFIVHCRRGCACRMKSILIEGAGRYPNTMLKGGRSCSKVVIDDVTPGDWSSFRNRA